MVTIPKGNVKYTNTISVLLPERFHAAWHVAPSVPGMSGCLQRVDPFTVAPECPAPESFTPSVDCCHFPANFISNNSTKLKYTAYITFFQGDLFRNS